MAPEFSKNISTFIIVFFQELHGIYRMLPPLFNSLAKLEFVSMKGVYSYIDRKELLKFPLS